MVDIGISKWSYSWHFYSGFQDFLHNRCVIVTRYPQDYTYSIHGNRTFVPIAVDSRGSALTIETTIHRSWWSCQHRCNTFLYHAWTFQPIGELRGGPLDFLLDISSWNRNLHISFDNVTHSDVPQHRCVLHHESLVLAPFDATRSLVRVSLQEI